VSSSPFQRRTVFLVVGISVVSFLGLGLLAVFGPEFAPTRSGDANVYSTSAVGHGALHDVLDQVGIPVLIHRNPKQPVLSDSGVLLILEPHLHFAGDAPGRPGLADLIAQAPAVLLALPKWQVLVDGRKNPHVSRFAPWPEAHIQGALEALDLEATLLRVQMGPELVLEPSAYPQHPTYDAPYRQFIASEQVTPLIGTKEGMLLGRFTHEGTPVYLLSDPDLLQNHGLHRAPNASLVVTWIDELRDGGPVAFDETLHGFPPRNTSLVRELFRFPLVLILLHVVFALGLVLWAGLSGFGDAPPPAPEVEPGSEFLIRHTAYLLRFTRHEDMALQRYVADTAREVALRYRLPTDLTTGALDARLDEIGQRRGQHEAWTTLKKRALAVAETRTRSRTGALRAAHDLYEWKREILDGTRSDSRPTQPTA
jgi:hypothetical protein